MPDRQEVFTFGNELMIELQGFEKNKSSFSISAGKFLNWDKKPEKRNLFGF